MARRFEEFYQIKKGDNLGEPEFWNRKLEDLDLRLAARELDGARIEGAVDQLISVGLTRINDTFTPVINEAIERLQSVGAAFSSTSDTEATINTDPKTFALNPSTWASYVVTDYVAIRPADHTDRGIVAQVTAYDRDTGLLDVVPVLIIGSGTYSDWLIKPTPAPDIEHATRTDNPHETTAAQVGAYTTAQTDAAILALKNTLLGGAGAAFDTLQELATALGSDAAFSTTVSNALAARVRTDAVMALTQVQRDRVRASVLGSPLAALAGRNLFPNPTFGVNQEWPNGVAMVGGGGYYLSDQIAGSWNGTAGVVYGGPLNFVTNPTYARPGFFQGTTIGPTTTPITLGASHAVSHYFPIDYVDGYAFAWGTASARRLGYALGYYAPRAATLTVRVCNAALDRAYYIEHAVAAGWNTLRGVVPGDTAGNWAPAALGWQIQLAIIHGANTTDRATPNGWVAGGMKAASTNTSGNTLFTTNGDRVVMTGLVALPDIDFTQFDATELGKVLPDMCMHLGESNNRCDWYFQRSLPGHGGPGFGVSDNQIIGTLELRRAMRSINSTASYGNPLDNLIQFPGVNASTTSWTWGVSGGDTLTWNAAGGSISTASAKPAFLRLGYTAAAGVDANGRIM